MASTVKIVTKPQVIHPGKERQAEHARQLVQQGLNRGMRLQETKIVPLAPDDQVGKEEPQEPQESPKPEPQKPIQKLQKKTVKNVTEEQAVKESPLTTLPLAVVKTGDKYKHEDKAVTVVGINGSIILLAETNLLKKGTEVFAMDYEVFKKKFAKV
jgi:hypothetical protein